MLAHHARMRTWQKLHGLHKLLEKVCQAQEARVSHLRGKSQKPCGFYPACVPVDAEPGTYLCSHTCTENQSQIPSSLGLL